VPVTPDSVVDEGGVAVDDMTHDGSVTTAWVELVTTQLTFNSSLKLPVDVTTTFTVVALNGSVAAAKLEAVAYPSVRVTGPVVAVALDDVITELTMLKFCTVWSTLMLLPVKLGSPA
jgi:hypothetical protein